MINAIYESKRLVFKPFSSLTEKQKEIIVKSWSNPINARYNEMQDAKGDVEDLSKMSEPTFQDLNNYNDCMYFRVAFDKTTGEIVGTCRFGKYYACKTNELWDFGFNVLLKHWGKGYGAEILEKIVQFARNINVKTIRGGADLKNYASYKAMIKNSFEYDGIDADGDYQYILHLNKPAKNKNQIDLAWQQHLERTENDLGIEEFNKLKKINEIILEIVAKIQSGENEDNLVNQFIKTHNI